MKTFYQLAVWVALSMVCANTLIAQDRKPILVGIQPAITIEPFYEKGELDVNVFPLVLEMPIGKRMNFRLLPTLNYHFGGEQSGVSDLGLYAVLPVFLKEYPDKKPFGFYLGPVVGFGRNAIRDHFTTTVAVEPGYMFEAEKRFAISLGCQLGRSFFTYDDGAGSSVLHWGPKVTFGFWLN
ncbi:MAG: hypothetical protein JXQ90_13855 [Cyclobacteriaceae bacterium]